MSGLLVASMSCNGIFRSGKELAFAFGINLSVAKLGSVINNLVSPALAESSQYLPSIILPEYHLTYQAGSCFPAGSDQFCVR